MTNIYDKKKNILGADGPRRNDLPTFQDVNVEIPNEVMQEIINVVESGTVNDLDRGIFLNQGEKFVGYLFGPEYRQIYLQEPLYDGCLETEYTEWNDRTPKLKKFMEDTFGEVCRSRISITPPGFKSEWHIDTDTSVLCRGQLIVQSDDCVLEFNRRGEESICDFKPGKIYFINVGWSHRLVNHSDKIPKISIVFGIRYKNIERYVKPL